MASTAVWSMVWAIGASMVSLCVVDLSFDAQVLLNHDPVPAAFYYHYMLNNVVLNVFVLILVLVGIFLAIKLRPLLNRFEETLATLFFGGVAWYSYVIARFYLPLWRIGEQEARVAFITERKDDWWQLFALRIYVVAMSFPIFWAVHQRLRMMPQKDR